MFLQYGKFGNDLLTSCLTNKLFVVDQFLDKNFPFDFFCDYICFDCLHLIQHDMLRVANSSAVLIGAT